MADRVKLVEFDIPPQAGATMDDVMDEMKMRRFFHHQGATFPGDIEIDVTPYGDATTTGYLVCIWEQPNLPDEPMPEPV
jgi:hypothetical protein